MMEDFIEYIDENKLTVLSFIVGIIVIPNLYFHYIEMNDLEIGFGIGMYIGLVMGALTYEILKN
jgi:uncharacterized membrane protein